MSSGGRGIKRRGRRSPRILVAPVRAYSDGADCARLSTDYGLSPDPWQRDILNVWLGRNEDDEYTATRCGLSVPRQNGKNAVIEMRELYGMCIIGEKILHTAHEVKTARKAFLRLCSFFEDQTRYPELAELVTSIRKTNGQEAIFLRNGATIEFSARSKGAARGFTVDVVVFDEAQELTDEQMEAIMSTMSASPTGNRQLVFTGTPPYPRCPGEVFSRIRSEALGDDVDPNLSWHEWSVEEIGDVADRKRWYATNPALGIRLDEDFTEKEMRTLSPDGFARERLGWWIKKRASCVFDEKTWEACAVGDPPAHGKKTFGVKFSPDGSLVSLAACRKPDEGSAHVELVGARPLSEGVSWLSEFLVERVEDTACIVIDGKNGADALIGRISGDFPSKAVVEPGTKGVVASANLLYEAMRDKRLTHWAHSGQEALDASALGSTRRVIGNDGGWGFGGDLSSPIEAASLAYFGACTTKRDPEGGCEIV